MDKRPAEFGPSRLIGGAEPSISPADEPPSERQGRMPPVLMYHSVEEYREDPHLVTVTPARFLSQMRWLESRGLRGVAVSELLAAKAAGRHRRMVGLTFDDGYADFVWQVLPVLTQMGFTATVFVVAGEIGGSNSWDDGPRKPLMTADQLRAVAASGVEIASHGVQHLALPQLAYDELVWQLTESRSLLEDLLQRPVRGYAYPYGHVTPREVRAVRAGGYDYGCAIWTSGVDRHALARTYIGERDNGLRMRAKFVRHRIRQRNLP
ncbi:polysaccharide deacetylase family protein [Actinomadura rupiterrae]|uniref:polysaccharide deacetylase family protein n=1 Tax=Actinomadura rupiterrae TaxID=559627 RepID=UPI0020A24032|nr:polysaccharide deacetylase family protein [Actinomadura rupiterrae]MCP2335168.1 peptidoglycan/xylan/chitin deacetylase (PgdA/CDA1 family) [Actinomadura rupiterrae]